MSSPTRNTSQPVLGSVLKLIETEYRKANQQYSRVALSHHMTPTKDLLVSMTELSGYLRGLKKAISQLEKAQLDNPLPIDFK